MDDPFDLPPDVLRRIPLFAEISKVLSWSGGPVNWDLARQVATSIAAGDTPARAPDGSDHEEVAEHVRIAELWLADTTGMPPPSHLVAARAASPPEWAEHATTAFGELIDPVAAKIARALGEQTGQAMAESPLAAAVGQMAPMFMGIQSGTILGTLAREVTGTHDVRLPASDGALLLVLPTIDEIANQYQLDRRLVRQWVALQAAGYRMAFEDLRGRFFSLYHNYVSSLDVDLADGIRRLQELDLSDPARLQEALSDEGLFQPQPSSETAAAAARVGIFLSLVDAFVDVAVERAATRAGDTARIAEAFARRAAEAGPGARMLSSFIGLEEHGDPHAARRFVREALARGGWALLARAWEDPDAFPSDDEIITPDNWIARLA